MFKKARDRRIARQNALIDDIKEYQDNKKETIKERRKLVKELKKPREERTKMMPQRGSLSPPLPRLSFCPLYQRNLELEFKDADEQPLGLPKGSIRAWITIWIVIQTCIMSSWIILSGKLPQFFVFEFIKWWLIIAGIVISSYFVSRTAMGNRRFFM